MKKTVSELKRDLQLTIEDIRAADECLAAGHYVSRKAMQAEIDQLHEQKEAIAMQLSEARRATWPKGIESVTVIHEPDRAREVRALKVVLEAPMTKKPTGRVG